MISTFGSTLAFAVIFWWFVVVLIAYAIIKSTGINNKGFNSSDNHSVIKTKHSIKKSILIGIIAGLAPVLILIIIILRNY